MTRRSGNLLGMALMLCAGCSTGPAEHRVRDAAEFDRAVQEVRPGDEIVLANGIWADVTLAFETSGTDADPITLRAEVPREVRLTGTSRLLIGGDHLVVDGLYFTDGALTHDVPVIEFRDRQGRESSHSRLTGTAIVDYSPPWPASEAQMVRFNWVDVYGKHNRIDHNYFSGKNNHGQTVHIKLDEVTPFQQQQPASHLVDHNFFGNRDRPPAQIRTRNGYESLVIGSGRANPVSSRVTVEHNYFHRADGEGEIVSNKSSDNIYRYNSFIESQGALVLRGGYRCRLEGNYFRGNHKQRTGGVRISAYEHQIINNYFEGLEQFAISLMSGTPRELVFFGDGDNRQLMKPLTSEVWANAHLGYVQYSQSDSVLVAFNTLVDNANSILIGWPGDERPLAGPRNNMLANNIVVSTRGPLVKILRQDDRTQWDGTVLHGPDLGVPVVPGMVLADPGLTRADDGLQRPPYAILPRVLEAKGQYPAVKQDIDGQIRVHPTTVGCDQGRDAPSILAPRTPEDVGPPWWTGSKG